MTGYENDGNTYSAIDEFLVKSHPAFPAEPHIEDQTAWAGRARKPKKFFRGLERLYAQAYGAHKHLEGPPDSLVVIDDVDDGDVGCFGLMGYPVGRSNSHLDTLRSRSAVVPAGIQAFYAPAVARVTASHTSLQLGFVAWQTRGL